MTTLAKYEADHNSGAPKSGRSSRHSPSASRRRRIAAATVAPNVFLRYMQRAVANPATEPMYTSDLHLSRAFNKDFAAARQAARRGNPVPLATIDTAVRAAYRAIDVHYRTTRHRPGRNGCISTTSRNGAPRIWTGRRPPIHSVRQQRERGGLLECVQGRGREPLNGARHSYQLTFPAADVPQAKRFWSLTAYVPRTIELVRNPANKYLVGSYTPGLVTNPDGSITIYMAPTRPAHAPMANWLPVPRRDFSVVLRAYGPTGNTTNPDYAPPSITPAP